MEQKRRISEISSPPPCSPYYTGNERYKQWLSEEGSKVAAWLLDPANGNVAKQEFVLIGVTTYGSVSHSVHLPAEIGMVAFSLEKGVVDNYATLIDPGLAKSLNARDTTQLRCAELGLPLPPYAEAQRDYKGIWTNMQKFMQKHRSADGVTCLFCPRKDIIEVRSCLDLLAKKSKTPPHQELFPLGILFRRFEQFGRGQYEASGILEAVVWQNNVKAEGHSGLYALNPGWAWTKDRVTEAEVLKPKGKRIPIPFPYLDTELFRSELLADKFLDRDWPELKGNHLACPHHMMNFGGLDLCPLNVANKQAYKMIDHLFVYFDIQPLEGTHTPLRDQNEEQRHRRELLLAKWGINGYKGLKGFNDSIYDADKEIDDKDRSK